MGIMQGFIGRAAIGAFGGAIAANGMGFDTMGKSALAGAAIGGFGGGIMKSMFKSNIMTTASGAARNPASWMAGSIRKAGKLLTNATMASPKTLSDSIVRGLAFDSATAIRTMGNRAANYIGKNAISVNKYGGMALGGIGAVSAFNIGRSVLRSNQPINNRRY